MKRGPARRPRRLRFPPLYFENIAVGAHTPRGELFERSNLEARVGCRQVVALAAPRDVSSTGHCHVSLSHTLAGSGCHLTSGVHWARRRMHTLSPPIRRVRIRLLVYNGGGGFRTRPGLRDGGQPVVALRRTVSYGGWMKGRGFELPAFFLGECSLGEHDMGARHAAQRAETPGTRVRWRTSTDDGNGRQGAEEREANRCRTRENGFKLEDVL